MKKQYSLHRSLIETRLSTLDAQEREEADAELHKMHKVG
jgi:hypothetical protein